MHLFWNFTVLITSKIIILLSRGIIAEFKWVLLALCFSFVLVSFFNSNIFWKDAEGFVSQTFLGVNLFLENLVFFVFSTFVVFGIKGFFEIYSRKNANVILLISGVFSTMVIFILSYQILFQE
jgi:hypothetical protein